VRLPKTVSIYAITDANQKYGSYWERIKAMFDEREYLDKDYAKMIMKRGKKAISMRWAII
jgi:hypothetical protein